MTLKLVENIIALIIVALRDNTNGVNTRLALIDTEYGDFTLPTIKDANIVYSTKYDFRITDYPAIEVVCSRTDFLEGAQNTENQEHDISLRAYITNSSGDSEQHIKTIYRYGRAIMEVIILKGVAWSLPVKEMYIASHDYQLPIPAEDVGFIGGCAVNIIAESEEVL